MGRPIPSFSVLTGGLLWPLSATEQAVVLPTNSTQADGGSFSGATNTGCDAVVNSGCLTYSGGTTPLDPTDEVLSRFLAQDGNLAFPFLYQQVNDGANAAGTQSTVSVSGRGLHNRDAVYTWLDFDGAMVRTRRSDYMNSPLRPVRGGTPAGPVVGATAADARLTVYPNPATAGTYVEVAYLAEAGAPASGQLSIVELTTGRVVATRSVADGAGRFTLRELLPAGAPAGLYAVRLTAGGVSRAERFQYQP